MFAGDRVRVSLSAFVLIAAATLAGCVDASPASANGPGGVGEAGFTDGPALTGVVTNPELVPIAGAVILVRPGDLTATTDEAGAFVVGPLAVGEYTVIAEASGYTGREMTATVNDGEENKVWITLDLKLDGIPYHETQIYVTYTFCATPGAPCAPINTVTSQNVTPDRPDLLWRIPAPGLANMRYEVTWPPSLTSGDKSFTTRNPEGLFLSCDAINNAATPTVLYFSAEGPAGFGVWIWPWIKNEGGCVEFDGTEGMEYYTVNRPRESNATVPIGLVLDQRIHNYLTFFYYKPGPLDWNAIPDE